MALAKYVLINGITVCLAKSLVHGLQEVAESVKEDFGSIDILVHSLANGPEVCYCWPFKIHIFLTIIMLMSNERILFRSLNLC